MIPMLTSKYYLIRIARSKDMIDLADAINAYVAFKKERLNEAHDQYCRSVKKGDFVSATNAVILPLY